MKKILYSSAVLLAAAALASCGGDVVDNGTQVTIKTQSGDAKLVRLEAMGETIIRVSATATDKIAD